MIVGFAVYGAYFPFFIVVFQLWINSFIVCFKVDGVPRGAEGGQVDPQFRRKSSSTRSSRKSFRLDYRLEVKIKEEIKSNA